MDFLYLSESQMIEAGVLNMSSCMASMEEMFRLLKAGDYRMGGAKNNSHGLRVMFPKESPIADMPLHSPGRWFTAMPAYLGGRFHVFGIKSYGANQNNNQKGLPRSILMMSLLDVETGAPMAYMSANILSAMRTGAVSGLAAKYFAKKNPKKVAVIGPGVIARYSLDAIMTACPTIRQISVLGRGQESMNRFRSYCDEKQYGFESYEICDTVHQVCKDADIVLTASSQAERFEDYPLLTEKDLKPGAAVIITSAIRVEKAFVQNRNKAVSIADDVGQYRESRSIDAAPEGECDSITFKDALHNMIVEGQDVQSLFDVIDQPDFVRDASKVYLFASGGSPLEDVAWGYDCYQMAKKQGIGTVLDIWEETSML